MNPDLITLIIRLIGFGIIVWKVFPSPMNQWVWILFGMLLTQTTWSPM